MEYLTITPCRIATWFCLALLTGLALRLYLGPRQHLYFRHTHAHHHSLTTMKGQISHFFFLGTPKNARGVMMVLGLVAALVIEMLLVFLADFG